jgi:hypothetical protein
LSSIDSGDNADDVDEGEVLEALEAPGANRESLQKQIVKSTLTEAQNTTAKK